MSEQRAELGAAERAAYAAGEAAAEAKALLLLSAVIEGAGGIVRVPERALVDPRPTVTRWTDAATREEVFSVR